MWAGTFLGRDAVVKQRFKKGYRHPALDAKLTAARLRQEVRSMARARRLGVPTPALLHVDVATACIYMARVPGESAKAALRAAAAAPGGGGAAGEALACGVAELVARLHDGGIVHGDLTTSNVLVEARAGGADAAPGAAASAAAAATAAAAPRLVLIDFGLSSFSTLPEDRAVDLYVLERALSSAHPEAGARLFEAFLDAYRRRSRNWCSTLNKFADVRMRGRKRSMVG